MAFFLAADAPMQWKGPMDLSPVWLGLQEMTVIREFVADVVWGELDYLIVDLPPGAAADKPPVIAGFLPELDGGIVVTTPSDVAKRVVKKSITYARDLGIRLIGLVENMGGVFCQKCGTPTPMFDGGCEALCAEYKLPLLGQIPFDADLSRACDTGMPLADDHRISKCFDAIAERVIALLPQQALAR
jgi:ATP-binding protein involved in chromosome partitioning